MYSEKNLKTKMTEGVMEIVDKNAYDIKFIAAKDLSYNPALGTGQLQIRDIHYVAKESRDTWEFCQLLDKKCIASKKGFEGWYEYARQYQWIKVE